MVRMVYAIHPVVIVMNNYGFYNRIAKIVCLDLCFHSMMYGRKHCNGTLFTPLEAQEMPFSSVNSFPFLEFSLNNSFR